ncbi:hypothetical protein ACPPVO_22410 [Dactylosporangium sp. McL0621]|uniref:hypothetical protein n=1 Tax=Dactylosporangium sp. McL0621 TaxID=3415678 RepID=UPI003CEF535F
MIVVGAVVALLKADPNRRVDYLKTLVWPVVVVLGYLAFRELINDRMRYLIRLSLGGFAEAEFEQKQNAELQADLREVAAEVREVAAALPDEETPAEPDTLPVPPLGEPSRESIRAQEELFEAVESAMKAGARWGYNMYGQYAEPPEPIIEWDDAGRPTITGATGRRRSAPPPSQQGLTGAWARRNSVPLEKIIADAEEEVRRCERAYFAAKKGPLGGMIGMMPELDQLEAAKKRLARVDPSNHLLLQ